MFQTHFYHETFKTAIKIFGKIFSNITIKRDNQFLPVPISYSEKDKILQKYYTWLSGGIQDQITISLPRLGFVMGDITISKDRQLNRLHRVYPPGIDKTPSSFNFIPITLPFNLSAMTKNLDDMFQISEQIIPFFYPEFTLTINDVPELNLNTDFVYKLDSVNQEQNTWDGNFEDRRIVIWTFNFTCDLNLYFPVQDSKLIKKIILEGFDRDDIELENSLFKDTIEVSPLDALASGTYEIITTTDNR